MRPGRGFLAEEPRYRGARDWRRLGLQAAADRADGQQRQGAKDSLFYGFDSAARNDIFRLYAIAGVPSAGPRYQLTI
jgi:hypothetical protein